MANDSVTESLGWMARLGSPVVLSWRLICVVVLMAAAGEYAAAPGLRGVWPERRLAALIAGAAVMFAVIALMRPLVRRCGSPMVGAFISLGAMAVAGALWAVTMSVSYIVLGVDPEPSFGVRVLVWAVFTTLIVAVATVAFDAGREHTRVIRQLSDSEQRLRQVRSVMAEEVSFNDAVILQEIRSQLADEFDGLSSANPALAAVELQRIADEVIRPLSHALVEPPEQDPQPPTRPSIRELGQRWVADLVTAPLIPVSWMVAAASILTFVYGVATFGLIRGVWLMVTSGLLLLVATRAVNVTTEFCRRQWGAGAALLVAGLLAAMTAFLFTWVWRWLSRFWPYSETIVWAVLVIAAVAVLLAPIKVTVNQRERAQATALQAQEQLLWETTRLRDRLWLQRHTIGRGLHGQVQAEMHAAAFRLAQAGTATDPLSVDSAKGMIMAAVRGLASGTASVDLDLVALRISATWRGLCRFSFVVDPVVGARLAQDAVAAHTVGEILTEATGNAVRHGRSTLVEVALAPDTDRTVRIDIVDNGTAVHGQAGLGTRMFDSLCLSWTVTSADDGTVVTAVVPVAEAPGLASA
jgi:signal transduction histidine kinase